LLLEGVQRNASKNTNPPPIQVTLPVPAYEPTPPSGRSQAHGVGVRPIPEMVSAVVTPTNSIPTTPASQAQLDVDQPQLEIAPTVQAQDKRKVWAPKRKSDS
jgi:hypothetical protein